MSSLNKKFPRLLPEPIRKGMKVTELIDGAFKAYNGGRLAEACRLFEGKMLAGDGTVGMSLTGALTPAGLGIAAIVPLMKAGFVDWIISTGANLYHDLHYGLGMELFAGSPFLDDVTLRKEGVIRIYDVLFDYDVLLDTDAFVRQVIQGPEFQRSMGTDEFHYLLGRYVAEREKKLGIKETSVLSAGYRYGVPIFTSSPGDSSIGMNVAAMSLRDARLSIDVNRDVNQTAAIVYAAKSSGSTSSVFILGGGSPKNFILQTEPQIQEVMGIEERGHDYFLQCTDARPDTGGLSGATPGEAVSWGKIDPDNLPDCVVCYADSTITLPLITAYALSKVPPRKLKRLYDRRDALYEDLRTQYFKHGKIEKIEHRTDVTKPKAGRSGRSVVGKGKANGK
ncbi:MAG TPA: deoxyhypusine synthase [Chthoniobacteraceae bacterium]|jgi:deoxyhypusine synthase|nr:deoxyhypusine synthase-like protein [Chthoniobacter sp.]HEV7866502.1 deoxyhypusine synthase [Chthoniobacteraceae bacterium]